MNVKNGFFRGTLGPEAESSYSQTSQTHSVDESSYSQTSQTHSPSTECVCEVWLYRPPCMTIPPLRVSQRAPKKSAMSYILTERAYSGGGGDTYTRQDWDRVWSTCSPKTSPIGRELFMVGISLLTLMLTVLTHTTSECLSLARNPWRIDDIATSTKWVDSTIRNECAQDGATRRFVPTTILKNHN